MADVDSGMGLSTLGYTTCERLILKSAHVSCAVGGDPSKDWPMLARGWDSQTQNILVVVDAVREAGFPIPGYSSCD